MSNFFNQTPSDVLKKLKVEQLAKKLELERKNKEAAREQLLRIQFLLAQRPK